MAHKLNRRSLLCSAASAAIVATVPKGSARASWLSDALSNPVSIFPGLSNVLAGFNIVQDIDDLVKHTDALESHINDVLTQVSAALSSVQNFVHDADVVIHEIATLLENLPKQIEAAFDAVAAKQALANLSADTANLSGYLANKNAIIDNHISIKTLCEKLVNDVANIGAFSNQYQFAIQAVPAITAWMQGYTSYNLLQDGNSRGTNPWDHGAVSNITLPRLKSLLSSIKTQKSDHDAEESRLPLEPNVVYEFDGTTFSVSKHLFKTNYMPGAIDTGFYYALWPEGAAWDGPPLRIPPPPPGAAPGDPGYAAYVALISQEPPKPGAFCYLVEDLRKRFWWLPPAAASHGLGMADADAAIIAAEAYPKLLSAMIKSNTAFDQLSGGWREFETSTDQHLVKGNRALWTVLPKLL